MLGNVLFLCVSIIIASSRVSGIKCGRHSDCSAKLCGMFPTINNIQGDDRRDVVPWHATIYSKSWKRNTYKYNHICGGTVISSTVVVSAAHCFWRGDDNPLQPSEYIAAVGIKNLNDDGEETQQLNVVEIKIPLLFRGALLRFQENIALLRVTPINFSRNVMPVCLNFDYIFNKQQLSVGATGLLASWGDKRDVGLKMVEIPFVDVATCLKDMPINFASYITLDKFCAGYNTTKRTLCKGDGGSGLVYRADDRGGRYYLRGVASTAPATFKFCVEDGYIAFTQIINHEQFIVDFLDSINSREVGEQPSSGLSTSFNSWATTDQPHLTTGKFISALDSENKYESRENEVQPNSGLSTSHDSHNSVDSQEMTELPRFTTSKLSTSYDSEYKHNTRKAGEHPSIGLSTMLESESNFKSLATTEQLNKITHILEQIYLSIRKNKCYYS